MSVRFGIVGCGVIHGVHADALTQIEGAELAAFYDVSSERMCAAAERYGALPSPTLETLLDEVDAVSICVPSGLHAHIGVQAARAGKHVVCEKPIDVSLDAARSLVRACEEAGVKLAVISQHRFAKDVRRLRRAVQSGELGPLVAADVYNKWFRTQAYYDSGDWRGTWDLDGGGCLMNQGVHYIDLVQWLAGGVRAVQAMTRTLAHERIQVEDVANVLVEYECGAVGVIQGSTSYYPGLAERIEVHGKWGTAILEADRLKVWKVDEKAAGDGLYGQGVHSQPAPNVATVEASEGGTGATDPSAIWAEQHRRQLEDFTRAILQDEEPFVTGRDALKTLEIILAIYESARDGGRRVEVGDLVF
jgi:UDP-N-acetyl-2-amino-2-deoxyglucuronate dehydrogenase